METAEGRRALVLALCRNVNRPAKLVVGYCNTLLEQTSDSLNREQTNDLARVRRAAEGVLELADHASQEVNDKDHLLNEQSEFDHFLQVTFHDLRARIGLIVGFSRVTLNETTGPLSSEQKDVLNHVSELGETLASSVSECQKAAWGTEARGAKEVPHGD